MSSSLAGAPWLKAPETRKVVSALEAARRGSMRFVGGCVRNTLMGCPVDDIDIATQLEPEATRAALEAAEVRAIPTGIDHGTITAVVDGKPYEITSLRKDVETDGRRAVVAFTEDWTEDALRRDFRLNALYAEPNGVVHDPTGGGLEDVRTGRVIFIGEADERLREDYLRVLRFYRFNAWYGAGIDEAGQAACARQGVGLGQIAAERIWKELKKMLTAPEPGPAALSMEESGVLAQILPGAAATFLGALVEVEREAGLGADPMRRLMAMVARRRRDLADVSARLRLSKAEAERLDAWAEPALPSLTQENEAAVHAAFYRFGVAAVIDHAVTDAVLRAVPAPQKLVQLGESWTRPVLPVTGDDALAAGLSGPAVGEALRAAEEAWIKSGFLSPRADLLARLGG